MPLLSVIVPVYNEAGTIKQILEKIRLMAIDKEIIVVDDGSSDGTGKVLRELEKDSIKIIHHPTNRGKGAAVLTGLSNAISEFVIIQDADLEYDPADYLKLLAAMQEGNADIILGARFTRGYHGLKIHKMGNRFLTTLVNLLFNADLNDCFTCYKLFHRETINRLGLKSQGFDIETEIVSKALRNKLRIKEVPITYHPRSYSEGKKIRIKDGVEAIFSIISCRLSRG
ncbi:MAG: glycosyltransferase family 2 protein [Candidatus Omnitrophica bacterium]|nr:glycosyltransferase family 2 protein [Candidatus Omnitrophota bacterium]